MRRIWKKLTAWLGQDSSHPAAEGLAPTAQDGEQDLFTDYLAAASTHGFRWKIGHLLIDRVLGSGGIGIVVRGYDPTRKRLVAVKLLRKELAQHPGIRRRLIREGRIAMRIYHPNVVATYAVQVWDEIPLVVMEYVEGETLQQRIDRLGQLPLRMIVEIGIDVAAGLAAMHAKGLVHVDLKPSNILLGRNDGRARISDFGQARPLDQGGHTQQANVFGSPHYMSPEQATRQVLDHRTDLFSLGGILYAMAAGVPPFPGDSTLAVLREVCHSAPRPVQDLNPDIPEWLAKLIAGLLMKLPNNRIQSAEEVRVTLVRELAALTPGTG